MRVSPRAKREAKGIIKRHGVVKAVRVARAGFDVQTGEAAYHAYQVWMWTVRCAQVGGNHLRED